MQIAKNAIPRYSHIAIYELKPKCDYGADESEVAERMSERADTAEKAEVPRGGAFGRHRTNRGIFFQCAPSVTTVRTKPRLAKLALLPYLGDAAARSVMCAGEEKASASTEQPNNNAKCDYGAYNVKKRILS